MLRLCRWRSISPLVFIALLLALAAAAVVSATASESFPFGSELVLDASPMRGSKRIPMLEIEENGEASIDLWCTSARAQATVGEASITIVPGEVAQTPCEPDRQASDANLLAALAQVTAWRRSGDLIELSGAGTLRFRLMTN